MRNSYPKLARAVATAVVGTCLVAAETGAQTNLFGFLGPEIFPIENFISHLRTADVDGDGLRDIVLVNNGRSRINLLFNQTGQTNKPAPVNAYRRDVNELPPDARFRIESIASEKRISSFVLDDFNGDGRPDIAYYGEPRELIVVYRETNTWSSPKRWPIEDGQLTPNALGSGDLNGDNRTDLILLAETHVYLLAQGEDHTLGEPERVPISGTVRSAQVVDIDGDTKSDLLLVNWEDRNPFRFRLQKSDGRLGPEIYFTTAPIRSYWADTLETNGPTQVVTIAQNSGRAQISEFRKREPEHLSGTFEAGEVQIFPLARTQKARRGMLWADLNNDRRQDLLVAHPENGQISIQFQAEDGSLGTARIFPTLAGVSDLAVADWDGQGNPELFLLSPDERQVAVTCLDGSGRLPFPTLLPLEGRPLVLAAGKLRPDAAPVLAVVVDAEGKRSLRIARAEGNVKVRPLRDDFRGNPSMITFHDVDQDGLMDLVILTPYERVKILRQAENETFDEIDVAPPGGALEQPWLSRADLDGDGKPELLLTQKNFLRGVILTREQPLGGAGTEPQWTLKVKEQINGAASNSRLAGATEVANATIGLPSLFLLDVERRALTLCERDSTGVWQVVRNLPLPISEFSGLESLSMGSSNVNAVALLGLNAVAVFRLQGERWELTELDGYETPIKDGRLTDVVSGDLDHDGRKDLVFLETARNYLDLVVFDHQHKLVPANRWQVFEERSFRGRRSDMPEPREAAVADITGDGKNDLIVLVHDRVLVYPQEP